MINELHLYHAADLGQQLGKRYRFSAGVHGDSAQKAGTRKRRAAIHTNTHRNRLSDAPHRVNNS